MQFLFEPERACWLLCQCAQNYFFLMIKMDEENKDKQIADYIGQFAAGEYYALDDGEICDYCVHQEPDGACDLDECDPEHV